MPALAQPTERQQRLALPATPFPLQIYIENPHGFARRPGGRLCSPSNIIRQAKTPVIKLRIIVESAVVSHKAKLKCRDPEENSLLKKKCPTTSRCKFPQ